MLKETVRRYAEKKEEVDRLKRILTEKRKAFDEQNSLLIDNLKTATEELNEQMANIRNDAVFEFGETGEKKLFGGIGIREKKIMTYDEDKAFQFAKEKDMFLSLDKKAFEKVAESLGLPFVTVKKETQVTFPKEVTLDE